MKLDLKFPFIDDGISLLVNVFFSRAVSPFKMVRKKLSMFNYCSRNTFTDNCCSNIGMEFIHFVLTRHRKFHRFTDGMCLTGAMGKPESEALLTLTSGSDPDTPLLSFPVLLKSSMPLSVMENPSDLTFWRASDDDEFF